MTSPFKSISDDTDAHPVSNNGSSRDADSLKSNCATTSVEAVTAPGSKKRFMLIDETKLSPDEAERLVVKRAYNRECAERARKRSKDVVRDLHRQIAELQEDKNELRRSLANVEKELKKLQAEYQALIWRKSTHAAHDTVPRHFNSSAGGLSTEAALSLYSQPSHTTQPMLQLANQNVGSSSSLSSQTWDINKLLFLQQFRKQN